MNVDELRCKLMAVARANPPTPGVPYAFEQRVMARLRTRPSLDWVAWWAGALWRASAPCVALMLLFAAWSWFDGAGTASAGDWSQDLENTVLAAADPEAPADSLW